MDRVPVTLLVVLQSASAVRAEGPWPVTVSGWIALATGVSAFLLSVINSVYTRGKAKARQEAAEERVTEQLNRFGTRVEHVEAFEDRMNGMDAERTRHLDRIDAEHRSIHEKVGEAKKSAEACGDTMTDHALKLGVLVHDLDKRVGQFELGVSQRISVVETDIKHLSDGDPR